MTDQEFLSDSYLERSPDSAQEKVITEESNTVCAAGAGSGKTQTLATRFAYLVLRKGIKVDRILTLTFTNKAAAEMYRRIYQTLRRYEDKLPKDSAEYKRACEAVKDFSKARIQTLDSYSVGIVKSAANLYGIRPDFSVGDSGTSSVILTRAFSFVMEKRSNPAIKWLSRPCRIQESADFFASAVEKYSSLKDSLGSKCQVFSKSLEKQLDEAVKAWNSGKAFHELVSDEISKVNSILKEIQPFRKNSKLEKLQNAVFEWNAASIQILESLSKIEGLSKDLILDDKKSKDWAENPSFDKFFSLVQKTNIKVAPGKNDDEEKSNKILEVSEILNTIFGSEAGQGILQKMQGLRAFVQNYANLRELSALLDEFAEIINNYKRKSGSLTFKDSADLALKILYEQGQIREQEASSFDKIMIDEFQDNNSSNRDLLLLISRKNERAESLEGNPQSIGPVKEGRLFFVGDEKQSIYKFRGADVSVFNSLAKKIGAKTLPMANNYRSKKRLIEEFNRLFGGYKADDGEMPSARQPFAIFPYADESNPIPEYEAGFNANTRATFPAAKKTDSEEKEFRIHACMLNSSTLSKADDGLFLTAKENRILYTAQKILELKKNDGADFSDFAILVKSRTDYPEIARIFSLKNIPFTLDQQSDIFAESQVNDLYSIMRLAVYPSDTNNLMTFLCSPFCGMKISEAEETLLVCGNSPFNPEKEEELREKVSEKTFEKYKNAENFFVHQKEEILSRPVTETLSRLWYEEGYRFSSRWTKTADYSDGKKSEYIKKLTSAQEDSFDLLFELARKADSDGKDASWFVDQLTLLKKKSFASKDDGDLNVKEVDVPRELSDSVQVMTIHKSKGLQFGKVFIFGLAGSLSSNKEDSSAIYESKEFGPVIAREGSKENYFVTLAAAEENKKNEAEFRRIVYVAATRAIDEAYIFGEYSDSTEESKNPLLNLILSYYPSVNPEEKNRNAPFDLESIPAYERKELYPAADERISLEEYKKFQQEEASLYQNASVLSTEKVKILRSSPSALESSEEIKNSAGKKSASEKSENYPEIASLLIRAKNSDGSDKILDDQQIYEWGKNDFGTAFHFFMESRARSLKAGLPFDAEKFEFPEKLVDILGKEKRAVLKSICIKMLETFIDCKSDCKIGELADDALKERPEDFFAEYKFQTKIGSYIFRGSIDAIFKNADDSYTLLDYKTDSVIQPELYLRQQAVYRKAAADLFANGDLSRIKAVLFYSDAGLAVSLKAEDLNRAFENLTDSEIEKLTKKN